MRDPYRLDAAVQAKIHINLPEISWDIITDDINTMSEGDTIKGYSNFVNYIVNHYIENKLYPTNFDKELKDIDNKINDLSSLFAKIDKTTKRKAGANAISSKAISPEQLEIIKASYISDLIKDTSDKYDNFPKGEAKKVDLNKAAKENISELTTVVKMSSTNNARGIEEAHLLPEIFDNPAALVRAILLDYTSKPPAERSRMCKFDICDLIARNINEKRSIRVTCTDGSSISVIPYGVSTDKYSIHSYLVGLSIDTRNIELREITRIKKIVGENDNCTLTKDEKNIIKSDINKKGVENLLSSTHEYKVKLSDKGINTYNKILYQRPVVADIDKDNNIYTFFCTKFELTKYFRRFGADAVIISPSDVHKDMLKYYKKAVDSYSKIDD